MTRTHFLTENEQLIAFSYVTGGGYLSDGTTLDTVEEAIEEIVITTSGVFKIIRINILTLEIENVSEQIADAYVRNHARHLEDGETPPPFVESSKAWEDWLDDCAREAADDERYGSYVGRTA